MWTFIGWKIENKQNLFIQSKEEPNEDIKKAPLRPPSATSTKSTSSSTFRGPPENRDEDGNQLVGGTNFQTEVEVHDLPDGEPSASEEQNMQKEEE